MTYSGCGSCDPVENVDWGRCADLPCSSESFRYSYARFFAKGTVPITSIKSKEVRKLVFSLTSNNTLYFLKKTLYYGIFKQLGSNPG